MLGWKCDMVLKDSWQTGEIEVIEPKEVDSRCVKSSLYKDAVKMRACVERLWNTPEKKTIC